MNTTIVKRSILVVGGGVFVFFMASRAIFVFADTAVVNAERREFIAPMAATVAAVETKPFENFKAGDVLMRLSTLVQERAALVGAEHAVTDAETGLKIRQEQKIALLAERARLTARFNELVAGAREGLEVQLAARESELQSLAADRERRNRDLERSTELASRRVVADTTLDQAQAVARQAQLAYTAAEKRLESIRIRLKLSERGLLVDENGSDVAYTSQRLDEVSLRLVDLDREIALTQNAVERARAKLVSEREIFEARNTVTFKAEKDGRTLPPVLTTGANAAMSSVVLTSVDCRHLFIDMTVAEEDGARFALGQSVTFRLSGASREWKGVVRELSASGSSDAAVPTFVPVRSPRKTWLLARITPEPAFIEEAASVPNCEIGRTAVVKTRNMGSLVTILAAIRDVF
jgi:multidrug resistance efflux pump